MKEIKIGDLTLDDSEARLYWVVKTAVDTAIKEHSGTCPVLGRIDAIEIKLNGKADNGGGLIKKIVLIERDLGEIQRVKNLLIAGAITAFFTFGISATILIMSIVLL
jgi:hypothetical protein